MARITDVDAGRIGMYDLQTRVFGSECSLPCFPLLAIHLVTVLKKQPLKGGKRLIFTQYADTASYLYENLNPGDQRDDIDVIHSGDKSKAKIVGRFAPKANPEYRLDESTEFEPMTLIATDGVAAERHVCLLSGGALPAAFHVERKGRGRLPRRVKRMFDEEVKQRDSERQHTLSLTLGQRYVMRELSVLFRASEEEDQRGQITLIERAFRSPLTKALQRELNLLRKNGVNGEALLKSLSGCTSNTSETGLIG